MFASMALQHACEKLGGVVHASNCKTWEAEIDGLWELTSQAA